MVSKSIVYNQTIESEPFNRNVNNQIDNVPKLIASTNQTIESESFNRNVNNQMDNVPKLIAPTAFKKDKPKYRRAVTANVRQAIFERDNYTCAACGISRDLLEKIYPYLGEYLLFEVDHIRPVADGGTNEDENLQTLCWRCNRQKGDKSQADFINESMDSRKYIDSLKFHLGIDVNAPVLATNATNEMPQQVSSNSSVGRLTYKICPNCNSRLAQVRVNGVDKYKCFTCDKIYKKKSPNDN